MKPQSQYVQVKATYVQSLRKLVMVLAAPTVKVPPFLYVSEAPAATEPHIPWNKHCTRWINKRYIKQECIPVGCVPPAHCPYAGVCFPGGRGVCSGGGGACSWRGVPALGKILPKNGFLHQTQGLVPPSGKSWIRHCSFDLTHLWLTNDLEPMIH